MYLLAQQVQTTSSTSPSVYIVAASIAALTAIIVAFLTNEFSRRRETNHWVRQEVLKVVNEISIQSDFIVNHFSRAAAVDDTNERLEISKTMLIEINKLGEICTRSHIVCPTDIYDRATKLLAAHRKILKIVQVRDLTATDTLQMAEAYANLIKTYRNVYKIKN